MTTVLLTGGIGSGKSEVAGYLSECGVPVFDCDSRAKALYEGPVLEEVEEALGKSFRSADGLFDAGALAAVVFSDRAAMEKVEDIVHTALLEELRRWKSGLEDVRWVAVESATALSKRRFDRTYDKVLLVTAPREQRISRVQRRSGLSREEILERMACQEYDLLRADAVINNDSDLHALHERIRIAIKVLNL